MNNKKKLYLHIGQDKAGSTAIQNFLFENHELLNINGYEIAGGRHRHHGYVYFPFRDGENKDLHEVKEHISNSDFQNFIMSFEGFYRLHLNEERLSYFISVFEDCEIVVIFYVRRRSDKLRSGFAQRLKLKRKQSYRQARKLLLGEFDHLNQAVTPNMDYFSIVRKWQKILFALNKNNIFKLRVYERSSMINGDLITDFCRNIDLLKEGETPLSRSFKIASNDPNTSLSPTAQYLNIFSIMFDLDSTEREHFMKCLREYDNSTETKYSLVPDRIVKALDKKYSVSDKVLAKEFFGRSRLFTERAKFRYKKPTEASFVRLIKELSIGKISTN